MRVVALFLRLMASTYKLSIVRRQARPCGPSLNLRFIAAAVLLTIIIYFRLPTSSTFAPKWLQQDSASQVDTHCDVSPSLARVVITVKTGATEASVKVPNQLRTSLRCAPNVQVYSDMAQPLGKIQVHDALKTIPDTVKNATEDFVLYQKQQELIKTPDEIVRTLHSFPNPTRPNNLAAWVLDKYKNNHIVEESWARAPDMDWYFHVDADTYVFLPSLAVWLDQMEPNKELHMGGISLINGKPFAHGGSGILLSNAATRKYVVTHSGTATRWDLEMKNNCCGDWVLSQICAEYGMEVQDSKGVLNGEPQWTMTFKPEMWCRPVVTPHHISPQEAMRIEKFERQRQYDGPVSSSEIFHGLVFETIPTAPHDDWDNSSCDEIVPNIQSMEDCVAACAKNEDCLQLRFNGQQCALGTKSVKLGIEHLPKDEIEKRWQSSWNRTRIAAWASKQRNCRELVFPKYI